MGLRIQNISLATRLSLVALAVTLISLAVTAAVGLERGSGLAEDVIDDRLTVLSSSRADSVELLLQTVRRQVQATASSPATAGTITELTDAVREFLDQPVTSAVTENVTDFYLSDIVPALEAVGGVGSTNASALLPDGPVGLSLQNLYSVPRETESGTVVAPEFVADAGDGSTYSQLHRQIEATFGGTALRSGFDDIYLIEAETETIVYSYRKRIDFATSLSLGPHSGSGLGRLLDTIELSGEERARMSGFSRYVPALERPTMFVAAPVVDDGELVGYVAAAISHEMLDDLLAGDPRWGSFGTNGDAYLINLEATMITTARAYEESPAGFRSAASEPGPGQLGEADIRRMGATGTTALVQSVSTDLVLASGDGAGLVEGTDYRGAAVRTALRPLGLPDVDWTIVVEAPTEELNASIEDYARDMLIAVALFVVAVTFVAVRWSNRLVQPVREIAARLRQARTDGERGPIDEAGDAAAADAAIDDDAPASETDPGPVEFVELADNVEQMLERLRMREAAVAERSRERRALLQQFLPAAVARRSEEIDGEVLDHVRQASVAVIAVGGMGDLVGDRPDQEVRNMIAEVVDELDALAADAGVERVKLIGSTYYAVCGAGRPLLDHAPRTVGFALRAREAIDELSDGRVDVRIGVAEGPVSVGLAERAALVYDVWGDTVAEAEALGRDAPAGTVMVSATIRSHLPDEFVVAGGDDGGVGAVTGRISEVSS